MTPERVEQIARQAIHIVGYQHYDRLATAVFNRLCTIDIEQEKAKTGDPRHLDFTKSTMSAE